MVLAFRGAYLAMAVHEVRVAAREASIRAGQSPSDDYPSEGDICGSGPAFVTGPALAIGGSTLKDCDVENSPPVTDNLRGQGDMVTVTLTYELKPINAISNLVSRSFNAADFDEITVSASVLRE